VPFFRPHNSRDPEFPFHHRAPRWLWIFPFVTALGLATVVCVLARDEIHTSRLQSEWLSFYGKQIHFEMQSNANAGIRFPADGPYNQRLGYAYLPFFIKSMAADDYTIAGQAHASPTYNYFMDRGIYPIYHAKTVTGLALYDRDGQPIYTANYPEHIFTNFDAIPPLLVSTLLFIENRELLKNWPETHNPVIEWKRFFFAALGHPFQKFIPNFNAGGGSTLATQIEKFRYSPGGETRHPIDKLRQVVSASLRVYLDGPDTRPARKQIVLDYLNSTPLSARPGFGEINSIGDGLWAWFGMDLDQAVTALNLPENDPDSLRVKAYVYRAALGLVLAQRRPTYYLSTGRAALDNLTDTTLDRLATAEVISPALRDATKAARFHFLAEAPPPPDTGSYVEQKATNALRNHLLAMLGLKNIYELDRLDLAARTTLDQKTQQNTVSFLRKMGGHDFLDSIGMFGFRLLNPDNDPSKIKWSVVLYERGADENKIRVQADNIDEPFDMNEGMKLDLGSTAKLRTLTTYLEIIAELYHRYAGMSPDDLDSLADDAPDALTAWAISWISNHPGASLDSTLEAAMDRRYSANPGETFFTGGGEHHFVNFEKEEDSKIMDLREAFRDSVNLVFVRLLRDIVNYEIGQGPETKQDLLVDDADDAARQEYLERFADQEGSVFLNRYITDFENTSPDDVLERISSHGHHGAAARTIMFRSIRPKANFDTYADFMEQHFEHAPDEARLRKLYNDYPPDRLTLSDRAYIAGVHPLELWLAGYLQANPHATRSAILEVSRQVRIDSYAWLFRPSLKHAQDERIRTVLEEDAFAQIQKRWARLGYPFDRLVPSLATAIGSSADRPGALAELVGVILNDGIKKPTVRFESLQFGAGTPYQTLLIHNGNKLEKQALDPAITHVMRETMIGVVDGGTAKRVKGAYLDPSGQPYVIGGKTGTGDHRYDEFGPGGRLISSRVMNRTGTFVFFIGDRFFGTITAHVAGDDAADYKFTSALSAQMLKSLAPVLQPLINGQAAQNMANVRQP